MEEGCVPFVGGVIHVSKENELKAFQCVSFVGEVMHQFKRVNAHVSEEGTSSKRLFLLFLHCRGHFAQLAAIR